MAVPSALSPCSPGSSPFHRPPALPAQRSGAGLGAPAGCALEPEPPNSNETNRTRTIPLVAPLDGSIAASKSSPPQARLSGTMARSSRAWAVCLAALAMVACAAASGTCERIRASIWADPDGASRRPPQPPSASRPPQAERSRPSRPQRCMTTPPCSPAPAGTRASRSTTCPASHAASTTATTPSSRQRAASGPRFPTGAHAAGAHAAIEGPSPR